MIKQLGRISWPVFGVWVGVISLVGLLLTPVIQDYRLRMEVAKTWAHVAKGSAWSNEDFCFRAFYASDNLPVTGIAASVVIKYYSGGTLTDVAGTATEVGDASYCVDLTATETNVDYVELFGSGPSGVNFEKLRLGPLDVLTTSQIAAIVTGNAVEVGSITANAITAGAIAADAIGASEIAADAIGASEIATDAIGAAELAANAIGGSEIATDAIDADALDADAVDEIWAEVLTELSSTPSATPALRDAIMLLYMALRNEVTVEADNKTFSNDAGTVITEKALSDDGTTYTEEEMADP